MGPGAFTRAPAEAPGGAQAPPIRQSIDNLRRSLDVRRAGGPPASLSGHPVAFGSGSELASLAPASPRASGDLPRRGSGEGGASGRLAFGGGAPTGAGAGAPSSTTPIRQSMDHLRRSLDVRGRSAGAGAPGGGLFGSGGGPGSVAGYPVAFGPGSDVGASSVGGGSPRRSVEGRGGVPGRPGSLSAHQVSFGSGSNLSTMTEEPGAAAAPFLPASRPDSAAGVPGAGRGEASPPPAPATPAPTSDEGDAASRVAAASAAAGAAARRGLARLTGGLSGGRKDKKPRT